MINIIYEISSEPIMPGRRITYERLTEFLPKYPWWEHKVSLEDVPEYGDYRKREIERLKYYLPSSYVLDAENGIIKCPKDTRYLQYTITRLQTLLAEPEKILAEKKPWWWWKSQVEDFGGVLFLFGDYCNHVFTLQELLLEAMDELYQDVEGDVIPFYIGGIFTYDFH